MKYTDLDAYINASIEFQSKANDANTITQSLAFFSRQSALWQQVVLCPTLTNEERTHAERVAQEFRLSFDCLMKTLADVTQQAPNYPELVLPQGEETEG